MKLSKREAQIIITVADCGTLSLNFAMHMDLTVADFRPLEIRGLLSSSHAGFELTQDGQALVLEAEIVASEPEPIEEIDIYA